MRVKPEFYWFMGIVEDRADPKGLGRLRVRIFGDHTDDLTKIPKEDLPWAQVMMPVTSASIGGVGSSPTGITQGSWVVGFYMDGSSKQVPFIMGTVHGKSGPTGKVGDGFSDPNAVHPIRSEGNDAPNAAGGNYKNTAAYITKTDLRTVDVETAVPDKVSSVVQDEPDSYYERANWSMPEPQNGKRPAYPFNKVQQTESGHQIEIDDTPGGERISVYHKSGTHIEILNDGTIAQTIKKDDYKTVLKDNYIYVKGKVNMTVDGDFKQLVKGNYHLEVVGNKTELVRKSRQTSIAKSEHIEIGQDFGCNVTEDYTQRIGGDENRIVDKNRTTVINKSEKTTITNEYSLIALDKIKMFAGTQGFELSTTGHLQAASQNNLTLETPSNMNISVDTNVTETIGGNTVRTVAGTLNDTITGAGVITMSNAGSEVTAKAITLTGHTHTDPSHAAHGSETSTPN